MAIARRHCNRMHASPFAWPPRRRRVACGDLVRPQRDQVAALVRVAAHLCARPASHRALKLPDRCFFRSAHNREVDRRMRIAPQAAHLKEAIAGVERIAHCRRRLRGSLVAEHPIIPGFTGELIGCLACLRRPLRRSADRGAVNAFPRFCAHPLRMRYPSFDRQAAMGWARNLPQPLPIVGVKSLDICSLYSIDKNYFCHPQSGLKF
jgi:hypothetical protein